jgi:type II secretory pathway pseudopilin PulG
MVEIAISLAVIGIALVAIIGVLPIGMNTQRDNREETIINQDATVLMEAIRGGARGLDDLTNYVYAITNYWTYYPVSGAANSGFNGYTYASASSTPVQSTLPYFPISPINNGTNIIGLLSTPEYIAADGTPLPNTIGFNYYSNHVVAYVRSISGPAVEKPPQPNDSIIREDSFGYRILCVNAPFAFDTPPVWQNIAYTNWSLVYWNYMIYQAVIPGSDPPPRYTLPTDVPGQVTDWKRLPYSPTLAANLHELRLTFLWPQLPNGKVGPGRQTFRTMVAGQILKTSGPGNMPVYFYQSQSFVNTP